MLQTFRVKRPGMVAAMLLAITASAFAAPPKLPEVDPANVGMSAERLADIDKIVEEGLKNGNMPGAVVLVGRHGGIVFRRAYGNKQIVPTKEAMTVDTLFDMASITKPMATATCVMKLIEEGKLGLDEPVVKYIPEFGQNGKEVITIRDLMTHQSGLIADNSIKDYQGSVEESFTNIYKLGFSTPHRTRFVYSDVNFIMLGKLVEVASGKDLKTYAQETFYGPLGMTETGYTPAPELAKRAAPTQEREGRQMRGEVHDPRAYRLEGVAGHAGLFSTVQDIAVYAQMMLNKGEYGGVRVFKPETVDLMTTANRVPGRGGLRGLGWDMRTGFSSNRGDRLSPKAFGHGGFTGTVLWIDPELDLFFVVLSNRVHPDGKGGVNQLAGKISNIIAQSVAEADKGEREVKTGLEVLRQSNFEALKGRKVGLITNQTGITRDWNSEVVLLHEAPEVDLRLLFSPEHGFYGKLDQAHVDNTTDERTGLPVFSLYGKTRKPTPESLKDIDTLVFDIQDIGCRFYTYPSTMSNAMDVAAAEGKRFVVLDRPNPINGIDVEGPVLQDGKQTFVGFHVIPVRHGMTVGELAMMYKTEKNLDLDLVVIPCEGWRRQDYFDGTGLPWVNPSPNMRSVTEALLYPAFGLIEFTNVSVGRGTDRPFELFGAPWINGVKLAATLNAAGLEGVRFVPVKFTPTAVKYPNEECQGVDVIITDRTKFKPTRLGLTLVEVLKRDYPNDWKPKGLSTLLLNDEIQEALLSGKTAAEVEAQNEKALDEFKRRRQSFLMY